MIATSRLTRRARFVTALALGGLLPAAAAAQQKSLTLDDIYDPEKKVDFDGTPPTGLEWIDDTHYLWPKADAKAGTTEMLRIEALTGKTEPLFEVAKLESALAGLEGVTPDEAKRIAR